ncbi:MAG TPA: aromatic ring-hydroxylating dioxygenase subunit alpha [Candidatus Binataceae bacterium]|nr:aromatic ring-hydroxylating dioxygenase subunit alpha [Candidatus Binataceae bacterium]
MSHDRSPEHDSPTESQHVPGWYPIAASSSVVQRKPLGVMRFGQSLVLWRVAAGRVVAFPDRCSHRAAALSPGKIRAGCLECPYHGLRFNADGKCVLIPANGVGAAVPAGFDLSLISVREEHGIVWQWRGEGEPSREVPWIPGASEPGVGAAEYTYTLNVPYLRIAENLLDFHHFPILHKAMLPGIGTRMDEMEVTADSGILSFSATMRYETPSRLRRDRAIKAKFTLPAIALIDFGGFYVNYFLTPVDETHTWLYARYRSTTNDGWLGGMMGKIAARYDRAIFVLQDRQVLLSQTDAPGDFSRFKLYPADRAFAIFWGMRKHAILDARKGNAEQQSDVGSVAAR